MNTCAPSPNQKLNPHHHPRSVCSSPTQVTIHSKNDPIIHSCIQHRSKKCAHSFIHSFLHKGVSLPTIRVHALHHTGFTKFLPCQIYLMLSYSVPFSILGTLLANIGSILRHIIFCVCSNKQTPHDTWHHRSNFLVL